MAFFFVKKSPENLHMCIFCCIFAAETVIGYRLSGDKRQTTKYEIKQAMDAGRHPDSMRRKFYFV